MMTQIGVVVAEMWGLGGSGHILKVELTGFPGELEVGCGRHRGVMDYTKIFGLRI